MTPNHRGPIYASIQAISRRHLTPDERALLDKVLDALDVPRRGR
jgi:hypothetical protein